MSAQFSFLIVTCLSQHAKHAGKNDKNTSNSCHICSKIKVKSLMRCQLLRKKSSSEKLYKIHRRAPVMDLPWSPFLSPFVVDLQLYREWVSIAGVFYESCEIFSQSINHLHMASDFVINYGQILCNCLMTIISITICKGILICRC